MKRLWHAAFSHYSDSVEFYVCDVTDHDRLPLTFELKQGEPEDKRSFWAEPSMRLPRQEAQQIMDALWRAGIRPEDGHSSGAHVEALQDHLKDLRDITRHALKMEKA